MFVVYKSEVVDISAANHTFVMPVTAIKNNTATAGTIKAKLRQDGAARSWVVQPGEYLLGDFESVTKVGTTLTTTEAMLGVTDRVP